MVTARFMDFGKLKGPMWQGSRTMSGFNLRINFGMRKNLRIVPAPGNLCFLMM